MKSMLRRGIFLTALLLAATALAPEASAQRSYWNSGDGATSTDRGGRVQRADRCDGAISLERILRRVRKKYPGRLLDADMRCARRGPVYILKMRGADNRIRMIRADATNGRILSASRR